MRALVTSLALLGVVAILSLADGSPRAEASFHLMRIHAVMAGLDGDDSRQYVELRMASGGQTQVGGKVLCFYAGAGFPFRRFTFPENVSNGATSSSILVGTAAMDAAWPQEPDFIFDGNTVSIPGGSTDALPVPWPGGKVAFGTDTASDPADYCGASFDEIDSLAFSPFGGTVDHGTAFPDSIVVEGARALRLTGDLCNPCARDNSEDYTLVDVNQPLHNPRNNAGETAAFGPPDPVMGDFDCDFDVEPDDGLDALGDAAGLGSPTCNAVTDVNCDNAHGVDDAFEIFRYYAGLPRLVPTPQDCVDIGQPVPPDV
jgi:hypothetical protein